METCLKAAFSKPMSANIRISTMNREPAAKMVDRPLMAILIIAAHEMEPPSKDEDESNSTQRRGAMQRPRSRTRRGGHQSGPSWMAWLHSPEAIIAETPYSAAYQLATLLIHKQLNADDWDEAWNNNEQSLRTTCMEKGVHPVWHLIGEKTILLSQFLAFPKLKVSTSAKKKVVPLDLFWVNPKDKSALASLLSEASNTIEQPNTKVALQKASHQLAGGRQLLLTPILEELEGNLAFVSYLLHLHLGTLPPESIINTCEKLDPELSAALHDYHDLSNGVVKNWEVVIGLKREDGLSQARRILAWKQAPAEAALISSQQLLQGLDLLVEANVHEGQELLTWWRLHALLREGHSQEALELLEGRRLDAASDISELLPLVVSIRDVRAERWLGNFMDELDEQAHYQILQNDGLDPQLRLRAAQRICDEGTYIWDEAKHEVVRVLLQAMDVERLAKIFAREPLLTMVHPYAALILGHVAPASISSELRPQVYASRSQALQSIHGAKRPESVSPVAEHLLFLMEGTYKETPEVAEVLDSRAFRSYSPISRAISSGGVVSATHLKNMAQSLDELDLSPLERRLFDVMLITLELNGYLQAYNIGMAKHSEDEHVNALLLRPALPLRLIPSISQLVMEHDLGLGNLVTWYQRHDPLSPWAPLTRAALFATKKDELNSAREYSRAADIFTKIRANLRVSNSEAEAENDDDDSALAVPLALYRKSLIHYAHAKAWAEAVDLLDKVPALKTAITERFKLYLRVCHKATTDTNEASRLIRKHVQHKEKVLEEDVEGNMIERYKTVYNEEELDLLRNYPFEQAHLLPAEPFLGRITAASTHISRELRRSRTQYEQQFRQAMQSSSPSLDEIYDIAKNAAEEGAFEGLMYLERAQNSTKFSVAAQKRLAMVEQSLFTQYKDEIPTSKRRFLHNLSLSPLVIVDTNILVDALVEKVYQQMNLVFETNLNMFGANRFHHLLLYHAKANRLKLMIPHDVRGELRQFAKDQRLVYRFTGAMVDEVTLQQTLSEGVMFGLVDEVLKEYNTWSPSAEMLESMPDMTKQLHAFLLHHKEVFEELSALKELRSVTVRTELEGDAIYPEHTDLDIYRLAIHLSSQALPEIGAVLVATMDGDFTLLDRAIEERFGFGVTKNNRTLKPWLARYTN